MHTREEKLAAFGRLLDIMDALREKCPWNAEQTFDSIRRLTEEEVYELSDSILEGDRQATAKEIGDLLYHMVFYARIGQEEGAFDIADSMNKVCDKMVFRHPHVFGPEAGKETTAKEIADTWELVKAREKGGNKRVMAGIPKAMPALLKALAMQEKARGCGFDWEKKEDVWAKVQEEVQEVTEAAEDLAAAERAGTSGGSGAGLSPEGAGGANPSAAGSTAEGAASSIADASAHLEEEFGDLLFAVINAARLYDVDPEAALGRTCEKFRRRFTYLEEQTLRKGLSFKELSLAQMDAIWDEAKSLGL